MDRDKLYYYNRNNKLMLTMNEYPYFADTSALKDWLWTYDTNFGKMRNFRRGKSGVTFSVVLMSESKSDRDALCDIFDEDVKAEQCGYLLYRGWKLPCYVTESIHSYYNRELEWKVEFTAISETSTWTRESTTSYNGVITDEQVDLGRDYSVESGDTVAGRGYDVVIVNRNDIMNSFGEFIADSNGDTLIDSSGGTSGANGYGYSLVSNYSHVINMPSDGNGFRVTFYGAVTNPVIYLNGQPVKVNMAITENERLEITSNGNEKTIYKLSAQGVKTDAFIYRDKAHSPFFSIGKSTELSYGEVKFDFTTIEQRSEPSWI